MGFDDLPATPSSEHSKKGILVLFRHGQTEYNKLHYLTGLHDVALTTDGEDQARAAGKLLGGFVFDKVYSSTLCRAFNTATLALGTSGTNDHLINADGTWNVEQRQEIVEADSGDFTARNKFTDPEILAYPHRYDVALPNGESDKQMVERVRKFYEEELLPRLEHGETVLVVSHSGIMVAFDIVAGLKPEPVEDIWSNRSKVPNASPVVFEYTEGKLTQNYALDTPPPKSNVLEPKP